MNQISDCKHRFCADHFRGRGSFRDYARDDQDNNYVPGFWQL